MTTINEPFAVGMEYRSRYRRLRVMQVRGSQLLVRHLDGDRPGLAEWRTRDIQAEIWSNIQRESKAAVRKQRRLQEIDEIVSQVETVDEAFAVGRAAKSAGDFELVVAVSEKGYEIEPLKHFLTRSGAAFRRMGNSEAAMRLHSQVLATSPGDVVARVAHAAVLRDKGLHEDAYAILRQVVDENPRNAYALNGLAGVCADLGQLEAAAHYFERAPCIGDSRQDLVTAMGGLERLIDGYRAVGDESGVQRVSDLLAQLGGRLLN